MGKKPRGMSPELMRELERAALQADEVAAKEPASSRFRTRRGALLVGLAAMLCAAVVLVVLVVPTGGELGTDDPAAGAQASTGAADEPCATLGPQFRVESLPSNNHNRWGPCNNNHNK